MGEVNDLMMSMSLDDFNAFVKGAVTEKPQRSCKMAFPGTRDATSFLFEWMPDADEVLLTRHSPPNDPHATTLTKEKARITWDNLIRAGYKICP